MHIEQPILVSKKEKWSHGEYPLCNNTPYAIHKMLLTFLYGACNRCSWTDVIVNPLLFTLTLFQS